LILKFKTGYQIYISSPAISGNYVYIGSLDNCIYCLNKDTGDLIWKFNTGSSVLSSPAISGNYLYIGSDYGYLYCLNKDTGELIWKFKEGKGMGPSLSSPAISGNYVYIGGGDYMYAFTVYTLQEEWTINPTIHSESSLGLKIGILVIVLLIGIVILVGIYRSKKRGPFMTHEGTQEYENSYAEDYQQEIKQEIPLAIKIHIAIFAIVLSFQLISGVLEAIAPAPYANPAGLIVWIIFAVIFFGLYTQLLKRKNWARIVIGILTIPLGLILLLSEEARSYCSKNKGGD